LLQPLAAQAAIAIENASLFTETATRTRQMSALLEVSQAIASTLDMQQLMGMILDRLHDIIEHTGSAFVLAEDDYLVVRDSRSVVGAEAEIGARVPINASGEVWGTVSRGHEVIVNDLRADEPMANALRRALGIDLLDLPSIRHIRSWMAVPLVGTEGVMGMLTASSGKPGQFTQDHARLMRAFAEQAAVALVNARLFNSAQRLAAVEERQRLARELHDSVSQALYGIALGARTARTQLDRDAAKAAEPVEYVLSLAEAGLAEMRALIFELRPESLETEGLVSAIQKQVAATRARYELEIAFEQTEEPEAPLPAKEALYRIAQEAMHNTVKHANASRIIVTLQVVDGALTMELSDNGKGFDTGTDYPGHLGLRSMRERVEALNGTLAITSGPAGTTVRARIALG
jgi:signal transduction histidine kinase